jgi:RNA polymerase sigma-70 factor (ECF subfamily)
VSLLRGVFGFRYDEIARATDKTPAERHVASRANKHVQARRPRMDRPDDHEEIAARSSPPCTPRTSSS